VLGPDSAAAVALGLGTIEKAATDVGTLYNALIIVLSYCGSWIPAGSLPVTGFHKMRLFAGS
jgi:hypothetical protein